VAGVTLSEVEGRSATHDHRLPITGCSPCLDYARHDRPRHRLLTPIHRFFSIFYYYVLHITIFISYLCI